MRKHVETVIERESIVSETVIERERERERENLLLVRLW